MAIGLPGGAWNAGGGGAWNAGGAGWRGGFGGPQINGSAPIDMRHFPQPGTPFGPGASGGTGPLINPGGVDNTPLGPGASGGTPYQRPGGYGTGPAGEPGLHLTPPNSGPAMPAGGVPPAGTFSKFSPQQVQQLLAHLGQMNNPMAGNAAPWAGRGLSF